MYRRVRVCRRYVSHPLLSRPRPRPYAPHFTALPPPPAILPRTDVMLKLLNVLL